ncbi:MAG: TIM barrel protein [Treponema sp.]|nr:TIM barrel protein [Treponema sp.]
MILGLQLYGPIACGKLGLAQMFDGLKKLGIVRVEPCITLDGKMNNPSFWTMEQCRENFALIKKAGLEAISCHVASQDLNSSIDEILQLVDVYGIKHIVVGTGELNEEAIQERAFLYRKIADILSEYNARLLLHNGKPDIATKIQGRTAYEYMADICLGKVGLQFDTGWCARGGEDPWTFIKRNESRIESFHYKDFNMNNDTDVDVCIGDGTLDNELFMQFARLKGIPQFIDADTYSDVLADAGKSFWYLMNIGQQRDHTVSYLNIYDTETGIANRCNNDHVISADETKIAVSSDYETEAGGGSRIFILPLKGGEAKLITPNAPSYLHGWSPDGKELAYCAFRNVDGKQCVDIYTISAEGGQEKRLTTEGFNDGPEYSPDGKHIWFISTRTGLMQLYRMNADGTEIKQMTFEKLNNWFGHVSPDGKQVVNLAYREGDLLVKEHLPNMQVQLGMMDYNGSNRRKILEFFGGQGSINVNSWSGDSRYFAFVSYDIQQV